MKTVDYHYDLAMVMLKKAASPETHINQREYLVAVAGVHAQLAQVVQTAEN